MNRCQELQVFRMLDGDECVCVSLLSVYMNECAGKVKAKQWALDRMKM